MILEKFTFRIRTRNGVVMERVQIQATDEAGARTRLLKMYPMSEVLETSQAMTGTGGARSFEDIADLLND
jgi:hypothetical protein